MIRSHAVAPAPYNTPARPALQDPAALRGRGRPQVRRYRIRTLEANGDIAELHRIAPALPVFEEPFCAFARGAVVETEMGPVAIEDLLPGDRLMTRDGPQLLTWIGSTVIVPGQPDEKVRRTALTRIMADSFGFSRPAACLITGPSARLLHRPDALRDMPGQGEVATPVARFLDGMNVIRTAPPAPVELFHLCLERHGAIRVNGMEFESYHPGRDAAQRINATLRPLFLQLFPHLERLEQFGMQAFARASERREDALV